MLHTQWIEDLFAIWVHVGCIDGQLIGLARRGGAHSLGECALVA